MISKSILTQLLSEHLDDYIIDVDLLADHIIEQYFVLLNTADAEDATRVFAACRIIEKWASNVQLSKLGDDVWCVEASNEMGGYTISANNPSCTSIENALVRAATSICVQKESR